MILVGVVLIRAAVATKVVPGAEVVDAEVVGMMTMISLAGTTVADGTTRGTAGIGGIEGRGHIEV